MSKIILGLLITHWVAKLIKLAAFKVLERFSIFSFNHGNIELSYEKWSNRESPQTIWTIWAVWHCSKRFETKIPNSVLQQRKRKYTKSMLSQIWIRISKMTVFPISSFTFWYLIGVCCKHWMPNVSLFVSVCRCVRECIVNKRC